MTILAYPRHFSYLAVATIVLAIAPDSIPIWMDRFTTVNALYGLLHGIAVALALRLTGAWPKRISFVALAATLSAVVPFFAFASTRLLGLSDDLGLFAVFAIGSAGGAAFYWILVRAFWFPRLSAFSLFLTICYCVTATLLALVGGILLTGRGASPSKIADLLPTIAWWVAFSSSLWFAGRTSHDR